jgi:hypothetical protein
MAVVVYAKAARTAARHVKTRREVRKVRDGVTRRAQDNLLAANDTTRISKKGYFPATITEAEKIEDDHEKCYTILNAPNALALEFGHAPSGAFGPHTEPDGEPGRFYGRQTEDTPAEYILTRAAIGGVVS